MNKNIIPLSILLGALIIAISYIQVEKIKAKKSIDTEKLKQEWIVSQQNLIDNCIETSENDYIYNWDNECISRGLGNNCTLPKYAADAIEKTRKERQEICLNKYK